MVRVELAVLDGLQRGREHRRHVVRSDDDAVFAVDRKDAADHQRLEARERHVLPGTVAQTRDGLRSGLDGQDRSGS